MLQDVVVTVHNCKLSCIQTRLHIATRAIECALVLQRLHSAQISTFGRKQRRRRIFICEHCVPHAIVSRKRDDAAENSTVFSGADADGQVSEDVVAVEHGGLVLEKSLEKFENRHVIIRV